MRDPLILRRNATSIVALSTCRNYVTLSDDLLTGYKVARELEFSSLHHPVDLMVWQIDPFPTV